MNEQIEKPRSYLKANWKYIIGLIVGATLVAMPKLIAIIVRLICVTVAVGVICIGCTTNQQTTALNTLSSLEQTTTTTYDGYLTLVIQGKVPTNDVPKVSHAYNDFQAGMVVAIVTLQGNTNALAPTNLVTESGAIIQLINTIEGKTP